MEVVFTALAATLAMQVGFFLWKLAAPHQPKIGEATAWQVIKALARDVRWIGGTVCTTLGWVLFMRATSIGEIGVVQPLMSTGDLLLVLMAVFILKERLGRREVLGLVLTVLGAVGLAWNAEKVPGADWQTADLLVMLACNLGAAALLWALTRKSSAAGGAGVSAEVPLALAVGLFFGTGAVLSEAWTAAAAPGWRAFVHPVFIGLVAANVVGLVLLQAAFQRGRASVIVPVQLSVCNAVALLGGAVLFGEPLHADRVASVLVIIGGAVLLQGRAAAAPPPADRDLPVKPPAAPAPR